MLVLVHIGDHFPSYINDCIAQVNLVSQVPVHILLERKHVPLLQGRYTAFPLDTLPIDELHKKFEDTCTLDPHMRGGFWKYATKRFFYLHTHMKRQGLKDVFHIENDNLVFQDFTKQLALFQTKEMWCIMDAEDRCIPGFLYFKNPSIVERLLHTCIDCAKTGMNDMQGLARFQKENADVGCLPIITQYCDPIPSKYYEHANSFGALFDGACVGQYLGGVDPRNQGGDTRGFINETTVFKCDRVVLTWKEGKPYLNSLPLVNLHIHSKDLKLWSSY